ncbi:MAG TPA: hypothetical protein VJT13_14275 [Xanthobacteraceae bacterium]|nr:hypothetical protein [Xanthobacteraceae bacterium]
MAKLLRSWPQAVVDPTSPQCLTFFLQAAGGASLPGGLPPLYATLKRGFSGRTMAGAIVKLRAGERVRVMLTHATARLASR